ncbi:iron-sulfur cluster assembly scaffold protein [Mycoplasma corogypsi]|uniref:iron-sulfur cluster assembly scaffold protein n=1 Tax=Mycoplasma corogypsi TaxID=2106 RepID=UPI0038739499
MKQFSNFDANEARNLLMDYYLSPNNKKVLSEDQKAEYQVLKVSNNHNQQIKCASTTCNDLLYLNLKLEDNKITDCSFDGYGCAVFLAATDIFISQIKNKTLTEAKQLAWDFEAFINQTIDDETKLANLGDLWIFYNLKKQPNRLVCASICPNLFKND